MLSQERHWTVLLAGGLLTVGALTLGPALRPAAPAPTVTRAALPPPTAPQEAAPVPTVTRAALPPPTAPQEAAPEYPATASVTPLISGKVNLNTATTEQLEALPRIGPALAARIVEGRPYRSLADLDRVKGIGPATLQALAPLVTF
ncbi:ComEA family DNA-binding protein [Deinococcus murrayi]|uniref:ComEA family DNA-binding protein n=1 Tax=Deinococcus murrayi TaxID=68910 RepID=UPI00048A34A4|nr:ComEA family DNA-binding protein [Deinococcus murrayi]